MLLAGPPPPPPKVYWVVGGNPVLHHGFSHMDLGRSVPSNGFTVDLGTLQYV